MKKIIISCFLLSTFCFLPHIAQAQDELVQPETIETRALVEEIIEEQLEPADQAYQIVSVRVESQGILNNRLFTIDSRDGYTAGLRYEVSEGQRVQIAILEIPGEPEPIIFITDVIRLSSLMWLIVLFILITLIVGLVRGFTSLLGLGVIMLVLFGFILPQILNGHNPVLITLLGSSVIVAFSIFITHGLKRSSMAAFFCTLAGLIITGLLAFLFVDLVQLTGLASDEGAILQLKTGLEFDMKGLLLAAIIIGALGVLDDVTVTQSETVFELNKTDTDLSQSKLMRKAMRVGRHHIASMVNTLVLAYAGAGLPLLLLFIASDQSTLNLINSEIIAEEIVRTLVGTIGLILSVPIATWFATLFIKKTA